MTTTVGALIIIYFLLRFDGNFAVQSATSAQRFLSAVRELEIEIAVMISKLAVTSTIVEKLNFNCISTVVSGAL